MKKTLSSILAIFLLAASASHLYANEAKPLADDPVLEQRLTSIAEELRCLVCQNESLAGSRADLAMDLRRELRTLIKNGKSDTEIKEFMVMRYGDFILYRPPLKPQTLLLWSTPFFLLSLGLFVVWRIVRKGQDEDNEARSNQKTEQER